MRRNPAWKARLPLIAALLGVVALNAALLVSYNLFYEDRLEGLVATQRSLETQKAGLLADVEKVKATEERLKKLRDDLETFYTDTLGSRRERLAPLIEDIYQATRRVGLVPSTISYAEGPAAGAEGITLTFQVAGRYADVKRLLYEFETNKRFLVVENVSVAADDAEPDFLKLNLAVSHYFRTEASRVPKRPAGARATNRPPAARPPARPARAETKPGVEL